MSPDFVLAVLLSSGAGYLLGKHYERKRAIAAIQHMNRGMMEGISNLTTAMLDVVAKHLPNVDKDEILASLIEVGPKHGIQIAAMNKETGKVIGDVNSFKQGR